MIIIKHRPGLDQLLQPHDLQGRPREQPAGLRGLPEHLQGGAAGLARTEKRNQLLVPALT